MRLDDVLVQRFYCYLLKSVCTPTSKSTYIGFSTEPHRRLRQHNGELKNGGACHTAKRRPWVHIAIVEGFPSKVLALQFEWQWQHPCRSRLRHMVTLAGGTTAVASSKKHARDNDAASENDHYDESYQQQPLTKRSRKCKIQQDSIESPSPSLPLSVAFSKPTQKRGKVKISANTSTIMAAGSSSITGSYLSSSSPIVSLPATGTSTIESSVPSLTLPKSTRQRNSIGFGYKAKLQTLCDLLSTPLWSQLKLTVHIVDKTSYDYVTKLLNNRVVNVYIKETSIEEVKLMGSYRLPSLDDKSYFHLVKSAKTCCICEDSRVFVPQSSSSSSSKVVQSGDKTQPSTSSNSDVNNRSIKQSSNSNIICIDLDEDEDDNGTNLKHQDLSITKNDGRSYSVVNTSSGSDNSYSNKMTADSNTNNLSISESLRNRSPAFWVCRICKSAQHLICSAQEELRNYPQGSVDTAPIIPHQLTCHSCDNSIPWNEAINMMFRFASILTKKKGNKKGSSDETIDGGNDDVEGKMEDGPREVGESEDDGMDGSTEDEDILNEEIGHSNSGAFEDSQSGFKGETTVTYVDEFYNQYYDFNYDYGCPDDSLMSYSYS